MVFEKMQLEWKEEAVNYIRRKCMYKIRNWDRFFVLALIIFLLMTIIGCRTTEKDSQINAPDTGISVDKNTVNQAQESQKDNETFNANKVKVEKGSSYSSKEEVAAYIHMFQELPPNYITKKEAQDLNWDNSKGNLWAVTDRKSIGGDRFYNREGILPEADGRWYYECDINYSGGYRGAERIVFSNDGLIFYTGDHYKNFERLHQEYK